MLHAHLSPSFFLLVKTVEIKSPFSLSHSLITPFFNPEMISLGMCLFIGLLIKSILSPYLTVSIINLSDVMELHWLK